MILLLLLLWILLNGKVTAEVIATGAAVSAALTCFAYRMFHIPPREELRILRGLPGAVLFVLYGLREYLDANTMFGRICVRMRLLRMISDKMAGTSFPNTLNTTFNQRVKQAATFCESNSSAAEAIWATLTDPTPLPDAMAALRAAYPNAMRLDYQPRGTAAAVPDAAVAVRGKPFAELFQDFFTQMNGRPLTIDEARAVKQLREEAAKG